MKLFLNVFVIIIKLKINIKTNIQSKTSMEETIKKSNSPTFWNNMYEIKLTNLRNHTSLRGAEHNRVKYCFDLKFPSCITHIMSDVTYERRETRTDSTAVNNSPFEHKGGLYMSQPMLHVEYSERIDLTTITFKFYNNEQLDLSHCIHKEKLVQLGIIFKNYEMTFSRDSDTEEDD
jgi:hypothetical protein